MFVCVFVFFFFFFKQKTAYDVSACLVGSEMCIMDRPMGEAAVLERTLSIFMIAGLVLLIVGTLFVHSPFALFLCIPAILYPAFFLADLYFWMRTFGMNLDSNAPLSNAIQPFVPPLLGEGKIAQFLTVATWEIGLYMSIVASILIIIGLYYHRKAYKPLIVG